MTTIYIADPMTGLPDKGFPAFRAAQKRLEDLGYRVKSPHRIGQHDDWSWGDCMRRCVALLVQCDAIHMLPGWEASRGARLELFIAQQLGLTITCTDSNQEGVINEWKSTTLPN